MINPATQRKIRKQAASIVALALLLSISAVAEQPLRPPRKYDFEFVSVADTARGFTSFQTFPTINNRGEVAFVANLSPSEEGVFKVRQESAFITVASTRAGLSLFGDNVALNAHGVVAFGATTASGSRAIFKGDGASMILIADSITNRLFKIGVGAPSINASGVVAFQSIRSEPGLPSSIFTGSGGPLTTVIATSQTGFSGFNNVAINDSGTVVLAGSLQDGTQGIFTIRGSLLNIVDTRTHPEFSGFGDPVINNGGTVADFASLLSPGVQIFSGDARGITLRTDPHANPPFANSEHPSINNHGAVAFSALANFPGENAQTGIFLEVSGGHSAIPVIRPGDRLFGSAVLKVTLGRFALNDRFQLVFSYTLTDGRSGIALASFNGERD